MIIYKAELYNTKGDYVIGCHGDRNSIVEFMDENLQFLSKGFQLYIMEAK